MITVEPRLYQGDVDAGIVADAEAEGRIAWDIETTGLNPFADSIGTCQLAVGNVVAVIQIRGQAAPPHLRDLLENDAVLKVFHHAPFDLRFMAHQWGAVPANVACTKIASKIVDPDLGHAEHSLRPALMRHLDVHISKSQQRSNWIDSVLTDAQIRYAAADVEHLVRLLDQLLARARKRGVDDLIASSYAYLPSRVRLDLLGAGDVFAY